MYRRFVTYATSAGQCHHECFDEYGPGSETKMQWGVQEGFDMFHVFWKLFSAWLIDKGTSSEFFRVPRPIYRGRARSPTVHIQRVLHNSFMFLHIFFILFLHISFILLHIFVFHNFFIFLHIFFIFLQIFLIFLCIFFIFLHIPSYIFHIFFIFPGLGKILNFLLGLRTQENFLIFPSYFFILHHIYFIFLHTFSYFLHISSYFPRLWDIEKF